MNRTAKPHADEHHVDDTDGDQVVGAVVADQVSEASATPVPRARTGPQEPRVRPSQGALRRQGRSHGRKAFHHPDVGDLTLGYQSMQLEGTPGHRLVAYYAEPGTHEHGALVLLDMAAHELTANVAAPNSRLSATTPDGAV
ncbi:hypothetical protein [Streptomyces sp. ISL-1]|uniref:MmyB family transcriptional regulator n=1 Tax=Streptomyces sp. ISL-1 TaxID=2817657 RepID=UPI0027E53020|nr:hypothetical protein [Streptomyces sp. ISL-1]